MRVADELNEYIGMEILIGVYEYDYDDPQVDLNTLDVESYQPVKFYTGTIKKIQQKNDGCYVVKTTNSELDKIINLSIEYIDFGGVSKKSKDVKETVNEMEFPYIPYSIYFSCVDEYQFPKRNSPDKLTKIICKAVSLEIIHTDDDISEFVSNLPKLPQMVTQWTKMSEEFLHSKNKK